MKSPLYIWHLLDTVKSKVEILQNFMAFPEYLNLNVSFIKTDTFYIGGNLYKVYVSSLMKQTLNVGLVF